MSRGSGSRPPVPLALAVLLAAVAIGVPVGALLLIPVPLGAVGDASLAGARGPEGFFDDGVWRALRFTLLQAGASTALAGLVGGIVGWVLGSAARGGRSLAWLGVPWGVPVLAAATAWIALLRALPGGGGILYTPAAVVLAHAVFNVPVVALAVAEARRAAPRAPLEAARVLGAGRIAAARIALWPRLRDAWALSLAQVFGLCAMSFALVLLLGGGPPAESLETLLYARVRGASLDWTGARASALLQLAVAGVLPSLGAAFLLGRARRRRRDPAVRAGGRDPLWAHALAAAWLLPYLGVVSGLSFGAVRGLLEPGSGRDELLSALGASAALATVAAGGATTWAALAARGTARSARPRFWSLAFGSASGVSALTLALAFWWAYGRWVDPFDGSWAVLALIQAALVFPTAFRYLLPVALRSGRREREAARVLGASRAQAFRAVTWPRWRGPVSAVLGLAWAAAFAEVAALSFFAPSDPIPLPLLIARWLGQYRFDEAQVATLALLIPSLLAIWGFRALGARAS